jgi:hypothetical protein
MASKRPASLSDDGVAPRATRARLATGKGDGGVAAPPPPVMNNYRRARSDSAAQRAIRKGQLPKKMILKVFFVV